MTSNDVEDAFAVLDAAARFDRLSKHYLFAAVMQQGGEAELAVLHGSSHVEQPRCGPARALRQLRPRRRDRPTGEGSCNVDDVLLRVAAVDSEGVQLEQLATVVFVQAPASLLCRLLLRRVAASTTAAGWPLLLDPFRGVRI